MEKTTVEMTQEQLKEFEAFKLEQKKKAEAEERAEKRRLLQTMTDDALVACIEKLMEASEYLRNVKSAILGEFGTLMELRKEVNEDAGKIIDQDSYTFTDSKGSMRIRIGYNLSDGYLDQVEEGIKKVKEYLRSLAKDEDSGRIVDMVLRLLSRDNKGNIKASRVIQLSKMAQESGNEQFIEGMRIIQESYRPTRSKLYIRCSVKEPVEGQEGASEWKDVPLSITEL